MKRAPLRRVVRPGQQRARRTGPLAQRVVATLPARPVLLPAVQQPAEAAEAFGMVIRDPFYEWNRHPLYPDASNYQFLIEMAAHLHAAGVRWVRLEFHAEPGGTYGAIDYRKYDWFITTLAPRFQLKILALLNTGILKGSGSAVDALQAPARIDQPNAYTQAFVARAVEIAARYGARLHAYEILNEPNKYATLANETRGAQDEIDPAAVAALLSALWPRLKAVSPAPVVLGGLLTGTNREMGRSATEYLAALYRAPAAQAFRAARQRWPFDAVGLHPYRDEDNAANSVEEVLAKLDATAAVMHEYADGSMIWVTEIGMQAGLPPTGLEPSVAEIRQANFLNQVFTETWRTRRAFVARVFWFKYEDFWIGQDETWGVVRIATRGQHDYDPNGHIARRRPSYDILSGLTPQQLGLSAPPPEAPTNLRVVVGAGGQVRFRWDAAVPTVYRIKEHRLYRASQPDMRNALHVATIAQHREMIGRAPLGRHYYALRALDIAVPAHLSAFSNTVQVVRRR